MIMQKKSLGVLKVEIDHEKQPFSQSSQRRLLKKAVSHLGFGSRAALQTRLGHTIGLSPQTIVKNWKRATISYQ